MSALRSETVHLIHTGVPENWSCEEVDAYYAETSATLGDLPPGTMCPPSPLPPSLVGWIEAIRFGQEELWLGAPELGATVVAVGERHLWVVSRGAHRLEITCTTGEAVPERPAGIAGDLRACRLAREAGWRIEVSLKESPGALWSARWRPAPRPVEAEPTPSSVEVSPVSVAPPQDTPTRPLPSRGRLARVIEAVERRTTAAVLAARRREHRPMVIAAGSLFAACLVLAVAPKAPLSAAATWIGDLALGRYRAQVLSTPPGALIEIDGKDSGARTPAWIVVPAGTHRLRLSLGEFGETETQVVGGRAARVHTSAALFGRLSIGNADSSVVLYAQLDGRSIGRVPSTLDSVPAGRRRLSFQGRDVRPWTEEVKIVAGKRAVVLARPERVPEFGHVFARAYRVGPKGVEDQPGAQVFLDGRPVGTTPLSLQVPRGLHTVRLVHGREQSPVQLLRVEGGGELFATAEFGRSPEPAVADELSGPVSISAPPLVRASLGGAVPLRIGEVRLFVRHQGREFDRVAMTLKEGTLGTFGEVALPLGALRPGNEITYFVSVESDEGEEFVSEMRRVRVVP